MAEVNQNQQGKKGRKTLSTRVDLTPMVDLGFLLITFFIFTTTLSQPSSLRLILPKDDDGKNHTDYSKNKTLNIILGKDGAVYYFGGNDLNGIKKTDFSPEGLRAVILEKQNQVAQVYKNKTDMLVLVKPNSQSKYKNLVDALDEMKINGVTRYMLVDPSQPETEKTAL